MKPTLMMAKAIFVLMSFCSVLVSAAPPLQAPTPPSTLFRVDQRAPEVVWQEGFVSWASYWGTSTSTDLLAHIRGHYEVTQSARPHTGWVSTTQSLSVATFRMAALADSSNPPQNVWLYEISPTPAAFNVPWALSDYLQRHPRESSARADDAGEVSDLFREAEWAFNGVIPATAIIRALRYDLAPGGGSYRHIGVSVRNPNYNNPPRPAPQTLNPIESPPTPEVSGRPAQGYEEGVSPAAAANGTVDIGPISLGMSCLGIAPGSPRNKATAGDFCYNDKEHIIPVQRYTKKAYTKLVIKAQNGKTYCLWPQTQDQFYGVILDTCANAPLFLYDEHNRIYTHAWNADWCMAVEPSVVDGGSTAWDYVKLEPCAINSIYQKWRIVGGRMYSVKGGYPMQDWQYLMMVSRNKDGYDNTLQPLQMNPEFFKGKSASQSQQVELQMGWNWNGGKYYSNFNGSSSWSSQYWNRSYYDYATNRISYINLESTISVSPMPAKKYCLTANSIGRVGWNWTSWSECYDTGTAAPANQRWSMKSGAEAYNNPERVEWRNGTSGTGSALWVQATGQPAGSYFSATSNTAWSSNSTVFFSIRKDSVLPRKIAR